MTLKYFLRYRSNELIGWAHAPGRTEADGDEDWVEVSEPTLKAVQAQGRAAESRGQRLAKGPDGLPVVPAPTEAELAAKARAQRDRLLQASDWTQVADAPVARAAWAAYRAALRDVTAQPGFPAAIEWPAAPGA